MIPRIDELTEFESFRRNYLHMADFLDTQPMPFIIETYTLPFRFIELQKQIGYENDPRDEHLQWIVHDDTDVFEIIPSKNDILKDFDHFRKDEIDTVSKITRILKNPLLFRQSVC
jgi:hypothetical protein